MSVKNSTLLQMIMALRTSVVNTINGKKPVNGNVQLTNSDIQKIVAPNSYIIGSGVKKITASTTAPTTPQVGDIWIDTTPP